MTTALPEHSEYDLGAESGKTDAINGVFCRFNPNNLSEDKEGKIIVSNVKQFHSDFASGYYHAYVEYQKDHPDEYAEAMYDFKKRLKGSKLS